MKKGKIAKVSKLCVACGTCVSECVLKAISISSGIRAKIDEEKCVGCGKCSKVCPASTIDIVSREACYEK
ncbi:MAG: 4Fe-4S binding protein [Anaerovoracaceae bacterium]